MNLLADENTHSAIVAWLRHSGHDVLAAAESMQGNDDAELLRLAREQHRVVVTSDLDFGELIFRQKLAPTGVLLLRLEAIGVEDRIKVLSRFWPFIESNAPKNLIVVKPNRARLRRFPSAT